MRSGTLGLILAPSEVALCLGYRGSPPMWGQDLLQAANLSVGLRYGGDGAGASWQKRSGL